MFIAFFTLVTKRKPPKSPSTDERINKIWSIRIREGCLAIKGRKSWYTQEHGWALKTWGWVEEASHGAPHVVWLHCSATSRAGRSTAAEWISGCFGLVAGGGWGEGLEMTAEGRGVSLKGNDNILKSVGVAAAQRCEYSKNHWNVCFK